MHALCSSCGYPLRGLSSPTTCPECGTMQDFQTSRRQSRAWFQQHSMPFDLLLVGRSAPKGILYALSPSHIRRLARRRELRALVIPVVATTFIIFLSWFLAAEFNVEFYRRNAAGMNVSEHPVYTAEEVDYAFSANFHSHYLPSSALPPGTTPLKMRTFTRTRIGWFPQFDTIVRTWALMPLLWVITGYLPFRCLYPIWVRWSLRRDESRDMITASFRSAISFLAQVLGCALWIWVIVQVAIVILLACGASLQSRIYFSSLMACAALLGWVALSLLSCRILYRWDAANKVFSGAFARSVGVPLILCSGPVILYIYLWPFL